MAVADLGAVLRVRRQHIIEHVLFVFDGGEKLWVSLFGESALNIKTDLFLYLEVIYCAFLQVEGIREISSIKVPIGLLYVLPAYAHEE